MVEWENMKKKYAHLKQKERDRLEALLLGGCKQKDIARVLKVNESTISREIQRNRRKIRRKGGTINGRYEASVAEQKAHVRRKYAKYQGKKINENEKLKEYIVKKLERHWNPDEISGRMKRERKRFYASKTAIYEWLRSNRGQYWCQYLYSRRYRKGKRTKNKAKKTLIPNRVGIELRPKEVDDKTTYGHYEGDTVVSGKKTGSKAALSVAYERKAKWIAIRKIKSLKPKLFNESISGIRKEMNIKTLTLDNGIENTKHEELNIGTYFCDPYSSWQKPGVENAVKMIRRFIPKGSDIKNYSPQYVKMVENILNNKPRKSLDYQTPYEVMLENNLFVKNKKSPVALRG
jgi:IS30 family transposase